MYLAEKYSINLHCFLCLLVFDKLLSQYRYKLFCRTTVFALLGCVHVQFSGVGLLGESCLLQLVSQDLLAGAVMQIRCSYVTVCYRAARDRDADSQGSNIVLYHSSLKETALLIHSKSTKCKIHFRILTLVKQTKDVEIQKLFIYVHCALATYCTS